MAKRQKYILNDGREMIFSTEKFRDALYKYQLRMRKDGVKLSREKLIEKLSEDCNASSASMFHWVKGHNGPSDLEKVENLANALGIATENLLETENESSEEKIDMNNIITENKIDYSTTKSVVRDLYTEIVGYIEMYRTARDCTYKTESSVLKTMFRNLYISLTKAKLDLPRALYAELHDFIVNYLQQMGCYQLFEECDENEGIDWDWVEEYASHYMLECVDGSFVVNEELDDNKKRFAYYLPESTWVSNKPWVDFIYVDIYMHGKCFNIFKETVMEDYNDDKEFCISETIIIRTAYMILDEILKDYIPD
ncbi:MAG: hypothetical protein IKV88_08045 [Clostridia bacterium]|nr:hypothetical protein [Clostridia bacterium]